MVYNGKENFLLTIWDRKKFSNNLINVTYLLYQEYMIYFET